MYHWSFGFTVTFPNMTLQLVRNSQILFLAAAVAWFDDVPINMIMKAIFFVFKLMMPLCWC